MDNEAPKRQVVLILSQFFVLVVHDNHRQDCIDVIPDAESEGGPFYSTILLSAQFSSKVPCFC